MHPGLKQRAEIDFKREMVVVAIQGRALSACSGHSHRDLSSVTPAQLPASCSIGHHNPSRGVTY